MKEVNCFKGISNKLYVLGFVPVDLVVVFLCAVLLHGIVNSLLIDFIFIVVAYIIMKRLKHRPQKYFTSLVMFFVTPKWLPLPEKKERKRNDYYFANNT